MWGTQKCGHRALLRDKGQDFIIKGNQLVDQPAKEATRQARPDILIPLQVLFWILEATTTDKQLYKKSRATQNLYNLT